MNTEITPVWRWVDTGPLPGPLTMAVDETLLDAYRKHPHLPIFRFYGWSPAAISLGRFQRYDEDIFPDACEQAGVPLVRRITGGGAIYHDHEVTYSLVCSRSDLGRMTVKESYRKLCGFLLELYAGLGLDARFAVDRSPGDPSLGRKTVHCFAGREAYDITVGLPHGGVVKLGGNAQRRLGELVFQHGSIPLTLRMEQQRELFAGHALPHPDSVTALYPAAGMDAATLGYAELSRRTRDAFAAAMGIEWQKLPLTADELSDAQLRAEKKYTSSDWNHDARDPLRE